MAGVRAQRVSLNVGNIAPWPVGLYVSIKKPDGNYVVSPVFMGGVGAFIDATTLPVNGTYTIVVDPNGAWTGSVTLTLYDVPADVTGTIPPGGSAVTVTITTAGQNALLTFSGTATQRISLRLTFLTGGRGLLSARVTPAEGGRLVFLTPGRPLDPGATYAVTLNGAMTTDGEALPLTELRFTTRAAPGGSGGGLGGAGGGGGSGGGGRPGDPGRTELDWVPAPGEDWTMDAAPSPWQALEPRLAPPGVTALAGQVLTLRGDPLPDVTLRMDGQEARTDRTGRALATTPPPAARAWRSRMGSPSSTPTIPPPG